MFIYFLFISNLLNGLFQDINENEVGMFPVSLTLSNYNILIITNSSITFYDPFYNNTITSYKLNDDECVKNEVESLSIIIRQFQKEYILIFIKNHLKIFYQNSSKIIEKDLSEEYKNFPLYDIIPIKYEDNYFDYILAFTSSNELTVNLFYYAIGSNNEFIQKLNKTYLLSYIVSDIYHASYISEVSCQLMGNKTFDNILVCFYGSKYNSKFHATSFDMNLDIIMNLYIQQENSIIHIKSKCNEDKSKALICFLEFNNPCYCSIFNLDKNELSTPKNYTTLSGLNKNSSDIDIYYFEQTKQYILMTKCSDSTFRLIFFDNEFNSINKKEIIYSYPTGYYYSYRETIIYLIQKKSYSIISDANLNGKYSSTKNFIINTTFDINDNNNGKDINNLNFINDEMTNNSKCLFSNESSIKLNLCLECNKNSGYFPVNYNNEKILKGYKECYSNETKPINFYFNKENEHFEPCYETCRTCDYGGNATINNCKTCDFDSIFRPDIKNSTNCVKECRYRYYITPYGQYKCSKDNECNNIASLYIKEKNKCINNCSSDDKYIFQYNGECLKECPKDTILKNNICQKNNKEVCSIELNEYDIEQNLTNENLDLIANIYSKEYIYTNNHISLFKHDLFLITLYKNRECIENFNISIPQIDFGNCYKKIKEHYNITNDLLALIVEKYDNGKSIILYSLYHPETGEKLSSDGLCNDENILIKENVKNLLNSTNINLENLLKLTNQNINIFNKSSSFFNDICFHFESPNGKDITLRDRIKDYSPNITLCNDGCFCDGINLTSLTAICQCKFAEILSGNIFTENAFISKISDEIIEIISLSNLEILKCYKDIFIYKYFKKNIGEFIILAIIFLQTICLNIFIFNSMNNMRKYAFGLIEIYLKYINPKYCMKYGEYLRSVLKENPPIKSKRKTSKFLIHKKMNLNNIHLEKENEDKDNDSKYISLYSHLSFKNHKSKDKAKISRTLTNKGGKLKLNKENVDNNKINNYMKEYLATDEDDMDYDDAIKRDKRTFCRFFWERVKVNTWIINIIFSHERLKPRSIKLLLFLLNIDLYFVINGLFFNQDYISEVYHDNEDYFFDYLSRTNYNLFYASMVGALIQNIINCFFVEEKKIKNLFRREKDNEMRLRSGFSSILDLIKCRYISFFLTSYVITIFSWYYITCFNNVYPNMKIEWIKSSVTIIIIMIFVYIGLAFLESISRFLSFKCKSEKIFKFSKIFTDCC